MACESDELASLPLLMGCPADTEWFLVGNAVGGVFDGRYARRTFEDIKRCINLTAPIAPLIGVVDGGGADDPVSGTGIFQNNKLIGLGAANSSRLQIVIDDVLQSNFGNNSTFAFDPVTGTIDLDNGQGNQWIAGSGLYIDLNQI